METTLYDQQWKIFDDAERFGWTGTRPGVLGTHAATVALQSAKEFLVTKGRVITVDKTLDNVDVADVKTKVPDVVVVGNGDTFQLLCKASSKEQGWMKSCKAMEIPAAGCVVQVTTQQNDHVAEALVFVPGVKIVPDVNGGRKLVPNHT